MSRIWILGSQNPNIIFSTVYDLYLTLQVKVTSSRMASHLYLDNKKALRLVFCVYDLVFGVNQSIKQLFNMAQFSFELVVQGRVYFRCMDRVDHSDTLLNNRQPITAHYISPRTKTNWSTRYDFNAADCLNVFQRHLVDWQQKNYQQYLIRSSPSQVIQWYGWVFRALAMHASPFLEDRVGNFIYPVWPQKYNTALNTFLIATTQIPQLTLHFKRRGTWRGNGLAVETTSGNPDGRGSSSCLGSRWSSLISIEHAELLRSTPSLLLFCASLVTMALHVHCGLGQLSPLPTSGDDEWVAVTDEQSRSKISDTHRLYFTVYNIQYSGSDFWEVEWRWRNRNLTFCSQ